MSTDLHLTPHRTTTFLTRLLAILLLAAFLLGASSAARAQTGADLVAPQAVGSSFNSNFTGSHGGWSIVSGTWKQTASTYTSVPLAGQVSSIEHSGSYTKFAYTARVKRDQTATDSWQMILVRGDSSSGPPAGVWDNAYTLGYYQSGVSSAVKFQAGAPTVLGSLGGAVPDVNGWNVLTVIAYEDRLLFYVNGFQIADVADSTFQAGSVGIAAGRPTAGTTDKFYVDYAKLQVIKY